MKETDDMQMAMESYKKAVENRYTYFLASILLMFFVVPLNAYATQPVFPFVSLLFSAIIITVFWSLKLRQRTFVACVALASVAFAADLFHYISIRQMNWEEIPRLNAVISSIYALFIFLAISILIQKIFSAKKITIDTVRGGLSVYILLGFFWALIYQIFLYLNPSAISMPGHHHTFSNIMYFSFTTLTTLGYGDIVPVAPLVRNLATLEAVIGQLFLATFIARLVGLHIAGRK